ncbi:MAG TPA: alpha/beta fold hydrolase [Pseudomonadales bacterium]|nr:alpha/beta fold hydrolase [Pseudomonadales bacterium]
MTEFARTPDSNFAGLDNYPFAPHYHQWQDMRMHYLDEGRKDAPVVLMLHGMPTWSYLYRDIIPPLVDAGYRCIAPDHLGFGKSDKPTDVHWFTIARHTEVLTSLITTLDLNRITLMCQDWGGPIGLAQAVTMPERFERLTVMNTWLHHPEYEYSPAIQNWIKNWHEGGLFAREKPNVGLLMAMSAGLLPRETMFPALVGGTLPDWPSAAAQQMHDAYIAPFSGLDDSAWNGARRFPLSIPFNHYDQGNGAAQTLHYRLLKDWQKPINFIWGCADDVFTEAWGRKWAGQFPQATFDPIAEAGHFLQNTHGKQIAGFLLDRAAG